MWTLRKRLIWLGFSVFLLCPSVASPSVRMSPSNFAAEQAFGRSSKCLAQSDWYDHSRSIETCLPLTETLKLSPSTCVFSPPAGPKWRLRPAGQPGGPLRGRLKEAPGRGRERSLEKGTEQTATGRSLPGRFLPSTPTACGRDGRRAAGYRGKRQSPQVPPPREPPGLGPQPETAPACHASARGAASVFEFPAKASSPRKREAPDRRRDSRMRGNDGYWQE
jgi:hypothetical protein